jgi:gas vesicle protein
MNTKSREDRIKDLAEQYKNDIKQLLREGRFNHNSLERHLSNVINQVNEEIRIITEELIVEEQVKKTAPAPSVDEKPE